MDSGYNSEAERSTGDGFPGNANEIMGERGPYNRDNLNFQNGAFKNPFIRPEVPNRAGCSIANFDFNAMRSRSYKRINMNNRRERSVTPLAVSGQTKCFQNNRKRCRNAAAPERNDE